MANSVPNLDELIAAAATTEVLEATSFDGATVRFELDKNEHMLNVRFRFDFPGDSGSINAPVDLEPEQVERLYRMARLAVLRQLADAQAGDVDDEPELPSVQEVTAEEVSTFVVEPLCLENVGRKMVFDVRADYAQRRITEDSVDLNRRNADYGYILGVTVHRSDCAKVKIHVKDEPWYHRSRHFSMSKPFTNGRFSMWPDILPVIRQGLLHVTLCMTCKPLGQYSKAVNARTAFGVADKPPPEMPWEFPGYYRGVLTDYQRQAVWRGFMEMTPKKWAALADLIEWAAAEIDSPSTVAVTR